MTLSGLTEDQAAEIGNALVREYGGSGPWAGAVVEIATDKRGGAERSLLHGLRLLMKEAGR
jgi:hypothetical protein